MIALDLLWLMVAKQYLWALLAVVAVAFVLGVLFND